MSTPTPAPSTTGFDPTKTPDPSQSITVNYLPMGISNILNDKTNNWIVADCEPSSSSNVTYTNTSGITEEYRARSLWIVGSGMSPNTTPVHNVQGATNVNGELVIMNVNSNGDKIMYLCYLLSLTSATLTPGSIDAILNGNGSTMMTVDLNSDISARGAPFYTAPTETVPHPPESDYIVYTSVSSTGQICTVIVYSQPLYITSVNIMALQNNLTPNNFALTAVPASNYAVIGPATMGEWMECDNVSVGAPEVASLNIPLASGIIQDASAFTSFRTIVLFIVFLFLCIFAYLIVPGTYLALVYRVLGRDYLDQETKLRRIFRMDAIISFVFISVSVILVCVGLFADVKNTGSILLSGFCIGMIYLIGYIIIQSKKVSGQKFIQGVNYDH